MARYLQSVCAFTNVVDAVLTACLSYLYFVEFFACSFFIPALAKGEINGAHAGRYSSILRHASSLCVDQPPPTVVIETQNHSTIIRDYNNVTVVMRDSGPEPTD